ncbi:porin family protein [Hymenobacter norwichensis]|uniref:porin family protein n=1 Tax=Hymenobacter norwichensis TaxID=223903 RepID=UPI0003B39165|nr:porin family protein [Hymenobacter norwichensis]
MRSSTLLLSVLVLAAICPSQAQRLQVGLKAGWLASTTTEPSARTARTGGVAGGWLRYPLSKPVSLQAEVLYEPRGVKTTQDGRLGWEGVNGTYTRRERTRLHYASLPLLVRGQLGHFFGLAGPHVSYLLAARQQANTQYELNPLSPRLSLPYPATETVSTTDEFRHWELGYTAGVGYQLGARLALEVRYAAGLTRFYKPRIVDLDNYSTLSPLVLARNRTWQAQLSYQLSALTSGK